jgi:class 3 adenylate cyclase/tetratricopeptide (TPR) repeat protein
MTGAVSSAELRLTRLLERLLTAAEASLSAGDLEPARVAAEEVRAVDPDNERAAAILRRVSARQLGPSGERALMTLLFSDLVGSTILSESTEPEQLRDVFAFYRAAARTAVQRYRGHVMQYEGDGILAGFGYPEPHEDDPRRAVLAGLDLVVAMRDGEAELVRRFGVAPEVRVGIHTGRVVVSDLGADDTVGARDSIVGLVPNLAARIQQAAEPGMVVISDVTQELVDVDFHVRSLGEHRFKGISRPVEVFAVERPRFAAARFEAERYRKAGLVGRDEPRDRLLSAWRSIATASAGAVFLVVGEAGIGKSRLVVEVLDWVEASGGRLLGAGCLPYYASVSLWPVAQMLERTLDVAREGGDRLDLLVSHLGSVGLDPGRAVPFLGPLVGVEETPGFPAPELDPAAFLEETLTRLVEWLAALGRQGPHLLVVEDLHWADPSTLDLLGRLVERPPRGILTLATTRDSGSIPWAGLASLVDLDRLDERAAARLVGNVAAGRDLSDHQRAIVLRLAEGVPLFLEELTRSALDRGDGSIPLRLQELFTWRLKAPGVDQRIVQAAATVGPIFDAATVTDVVGVPEAVADQLRVLTDHGIVEPVGPTGTFRFRHALMRDAAYETQVLDVRRKTHGQVGEVLARQGAEPALVAQHLDLAGEAERAAALYLAAAQGEQGRGAHTEATRLLTRAIDLLAGLPESDERDLRELTARMLRGLSVSSTQGYAFPAVQTDQRRAEELATRLGPRPEVLPSLIAIWSYWLINGNGGTARGLIERLTGMVRSDAFAWFMPEVAACAGWQEFFAGNLLSAREQLERAVAGFAGRTAGQTVSAFWPLPNDPVAVSQIALACISGLRGDADESARREREALRRAQEIGYPLGPFSFAFVTVFAAWLRRFTGDFEESWRLGAQVVAIGQQHGYVFWETLGSCYSAVDPPGGPAHREQLRRSVEALRTMGQEAFTAAHFGYLGRLEAAAGNLEEALRLVAEAIEVTHKTGEYLHLPELLRQRAETLLAFGADPGDVVSDLVEAARVAGEQSALVARLRALVGIARLPAPARPSGWRDALARARADLPEGSPATNDTAAADALLAS